MIHVFTLDGKPQSATTPFSTLLTKVAVSFDGKLTAAGDYQGRLILWDGHETQVIDPQGIRQAQAGVK